MLLSSDEIKDSEFIKMVHCNQSHNFWKHTKVEKEKMKKLDKKEKKQAKYQPPNNSYLYKLCSSVSVLCMM